MCLRDESESISMTSAPATATLIPHSQYRLPVLGDLLTIDFANPTQGLTTQLRKHGKGIIEQRLFKLKFIVISDTALIEDANDETLWEKHTERLASKLGPLGGDGLFTAHNHEPNWRKAHNILMPAFTKTAMARYHDTMTAAVRELIEPWNTTSSWIDIPSETNRLTSEIIARAGMGHTFTKLSDPPDNPFADALHRQLHYAQRRTDAIPFYDDLVGYKRKRQSEKDIAYTRRTVADIIEARRRTPSRVPAGDILDIMLHNADPDSGEKLGDDNIINQILTFLVAGSETSANTIAFALHFLSTHPDVAEQARREIDQYWPGRDFPAIGYPDVAKLRYLRRIVDETLRLWPVAPGYLRQARQDTTVGNGKYRFRKGDWVAVLLTAAHRSDAWGPDANEFNPDRFLAENLRKLPPHTYKPFGTGPRACIGRQFALHEIVVALAAILHQYDLEPKPGYQLKVRDAVTLKPVGLQLRPHPR